EVFDLLARADEQAEEKRIGVFNQLLYPFMLLFLISSVVEIILFYVYPQFRTMIEDVGAAEFSSAAPLMALWEPIARNMPLVLLLIGALLICLVPFPWGPRFGDSFPPIRWMRWVWRRLIPPLGRAYFRAASARWARVVSLMVEAGTPLPEAARRAADIEPDGTFRKAANRWAEKISSGQAVSRALSEERYVPRSLVWQIRCAEGGSELPRILRQAGQREATRLQRQVGNVIMVLIPFFVLAIAAVVGVIACGLFGTLTGMMHALM
ncbi:MAG: type II secretion system F family protein, partial [Planctomycetota bacterium]